MGRHGPLGNLRALDGFSRPLEDVRIRSVSGAALTLVSFLIISILTISSWIDYRRVTLSHSLEVDRSRGEKLSINVDMSFPRVPCYLLSIDVMDISGEHLDDVKHDITRTRLDQNGKTIDASMELKGDADKIAAQRGKDYCGSCYGGNPPAGGCCNTCEDVREAYGRRGWSFNDPEHIEQCITEGWTEKIQAQSKEGCRVTGRLHVNKVVGNFHLSPGRSFSRNNVHTHDVVPYLKGAGEEHHDFGHIIHTFSFGAEDEFHHPLEFVTTPTLGRIAKNRLEIRDPLEGLHAKAGSSEYMFQYFTKVVATEYRSLNGKDKMVTYQYSATSFERDLGPKAIGGAVVSPSGSEASGTHSPGLVQHGFGGIPGVFVNFDISPLRTIHTERRQPFSRFLASLCAIAGGVFTLAGLVDAAIWNWRIRTSSGSRRGVNGSGAGSGGIGGIGGIGGGGGLMGNGYGGGGGGGYGMGMAGARGKLI